MSEVHNLSEVLAALYPQDTKDRLRAQYTQFTSVFLAEIAAAFIGTCISKVGDADITGSEWIVRNCADTMHQAPALLCDVGFSDLPDSTVDTQVTSSIENVRKCIAQTR